MISAKSVTKRMLEVAKTVSTKTDGWFNVLTGMGVQGRDKRLSNQAVWERWTENQLEQLYATDDVARRIVDFIPDEGTRAWIDLKATNTDVAKAITEQMTLLEIKSKLNNGWKLGRQCGGAGALVVVDDGKELFEPLDLASIREFKGLTVLNKFELNTLKVIEDLENPDFGKQELYSLNPSQVDVRDTGKAVHYTRIIRFNGLPLPRRLFQMNDHWDDSVLPKVMNAIRNYNSSHDAVAAALQDFRLMILKLKDLADMVGSDSDQALLSRLQIMNLSKGILGSIAIDAEAEEITHLDTNFTNIDKVLEKVEARLVTASDLPHTVVLGEGASGTLSGAGESEEDNVKDYVSAQQELHLRKPIDRVLAIIQAAKRGPTGGALADGLTWKFNPLYQESAMEKATLHKTQAEADAVYLERGVVSAGNIAKSRFGGAEYSVETLPEEAFAEKAVVTPAPAAKVDQALAPTDHSHFVDIPGVGSGYTTNANGEGDNHTHTMPNGVESGPVIPLFGGGHIHGVSAGIGQLTQNFTGPAISMGVVSEIQAIQMQHMDKPKECQIDYDGRRGIFIVRDEGEKKLCAVVVTKEFFKTIDAATKEAQKFTDSGTIITELKDRFKFVVIDHKDKIRDGSYRYLNPPVKGVTLVFGELKA